MCISMKFESKNLKIFNLAATKEEILEGGGEDVYQKSPPSKTSLKCPKNKICIFVFFF